MLTYLGSYSLAVLLPGIVAALNVALPDLQARVDALLAFNPGEINLAASLQLAASITADLTGAIALGITPPSIAAQIAIVVDILGILQANLQAILAFQGLLVHGGVYAYVYDGQAGSLGSELAASTSGGLPGGTATEHCNALILATSVGASWTAMQGIFKLSI